MAMFPRCWAERKKNDSLRTRHQLTRQGLPRRTPVSHWVLRWNSPWSFGWTVITPAEVLPVSGSAVSEVAAARGFASAEGASIVRYARSSVDGATDDKG